MHRFIWTLLGHETKVQSLRIKKKPDCTSERVFLSPMAHAAVDHGPGGQPLDLDNSLGRESAARPAVLAPQPPMSREVEEEQDIVTIPSWRANRIPMLVAEYLARKSHWLAIESTIDESQLDLDSSVRPSTIVLAS
jgi:hypothetical protein